MCRQAEITVPCDPAAVAGTRHWALAELASVYADVGESALDIQTVVSELVTNAVQAHCRRLSLALDAHHSYVRITAGDDAAGDPVKQDPTPEQSHGRGLLIVDALSTRWGVERHDGHKTVWADVPLMKSVGPVFECHD